MRSFQKLADTDWSVVSAQQCSAPSIHYLNGRGLEVLRWYYVQGDDKCSLARVVIRGFLARSCLDHGLLGSENRGGRGASVPRSSEKLSSGSSRHIASPNPRRAPPGGAVNNISLSFSELREACKLNTVFVVCSCARSSGLWSLIILIKA